MLPKEDNELLCRVGPDTPMGNLLRQYWIPAMPSYELPEPDSPPLRVRLLSENLVAFRDTAGKVGMVVEACPHRGASLFFGRNEEEGLRCVYHGWKFDTEGNCVDMPSEPAESNFKNKVRVRTYPCRDVNHMIWVYMGPREVPPPFPQFDITTLPPEQVNEPQIMMEEANWFQNLEGDIDSSHIDYLHSRLHKDGTMADGSPGFFSRDKAPVLDVVPTNYGAFYSGIRQWDDEGNVWHRVSQFIFPFHTMIAAGSGDSVHLRAHVPVDDHHSMLISQPARLNRTITEEERTRARDPYASSGGYLPRTSDPRSRYFTAANKRNDYLRDYEVEKTTQYTGIPSGGNLQDRAMTELMTNAEGIEPIYDRSKEHLGTTDRMVILTRRLLINAARQLQEDGVAPANVDQTKLDWVRSASIILKADEDWVAATEQARNPQSTDTPVAYVVPAIV